MDTNDLIRHFQTKERARQKLKVSRQLWHIWEKNGIPEGKQASIQILTRGRLKAEIQK